LNRRDRKKENTRNGLLDAALKLFEKKGIYTTRVEDITEHADVAKGVFYNYFDSKFSLVAELLTDAVQLLEKNYLKQIPDNLPETDRIQEVVTKHEAFWRDHPEYALLFHQSRGVILVDPDSSPKLRESIREYLECLGRHLVSQQQKNETDHETILQWASALAGLIAGHRSFAIAAGIPLNSSLTATMATEGLVSFIESSLSGG
jgi:AcrR family transcriptional regulator